MAENESLGLLTDLVRDPGIPTTVRLEPDIRWAVEDLARTFQHDISWAVRHVLKVGLRTLGLWLPPEEVDAETRRFEEALAASQPSAAEELSDRQPTTVER